LDKQKSVKQEKTKKTIALDATNNLHNNANVA